jgi:hypothetical protein
MLGAVANPLTGGNIMQNPIAHSDIFKTPESFEELVRIAESMDNSSQAWLMLTFTMNYCHALVEKQLGA